MSVAGAPGEVAEVVAAVIERDGKVLIARRREGTHLAGLWEFPGGKRRPGEAPADALRREIREELGAVLVVGETIETVDWDYPEKRVRLSFFRCAIEGEARPLEGQEMAWVTRADLGRYEFPAADAALVARLSRG
jgi:mutator protein MutT